ncbi:toxin glutamine deamidase domain-containing protein [Allorhizocola rhizosphaerae]|uniref:WXG100-like domain-containing protein n=1 Tax=Allorhizocola rhizosphaerae TaxID=1872709 RepID=UPI0013C2BF94|nr:toxin glutamine deamidase domain-containing protein [Allorhizocola rhizosphaerae]
MPLPSPIPHPRSSLGANAAIERVVGGDWPEGDERALRGLSDQWREAARLVGPLVEDAGRAVSGAVTAFGGAGTRQGDALQRLWEKTGGSLGVEAFEGLGELAAAGARVIEAAKLEIYVHVTQMLTDLERLGALSSAGSGVPATTVAAEPVILAARCAVERVLDKAINELNELGSTAAAVKTQLGQFSFGVPMLAEQLTTVDGVAAAGAAGSTTQAPQAEGGDLAMAYGVGYLGTATGAAAMVGGGAPRGTALRGRFGERALRGGHVAEVLSAVTVNVITNESPKRPGDLAGVSAAVPVAPEPVKALHASREATAALSSLDNPRLTGMEPVKAPAPMAEALTRPNVGLGLGLPSAEQQTGGAAAYVKAPTAAAAVGAAPSVSGAAGLGASRSEVAGLGSPRSEVVGLGTSRSEVASAARTPATSATTEAVAPASKEARRTGGAVTSATRAAAASGAISSFTLSALSQTPTSESPSPSSSPLSPSPEGSEEGREPAPFMLLMQAQATTPTPEVKVTDEAREPTPKEYEDLIAEGVAAGRRRSDAVAVPRELPPVQQQALEASRPEQFGDLHGDWLRLIDAGGPAVDAGRATISVAVVESVLDTWLRGEPRVAQPGTHQIKMEMSEKLQRLRPDGQGLARVQAALRIEGHGSCAVIVQERVHGERHATTIHNRHGELFYVDAQRKVAPVSTAPPPTEGVIRLDAMALTAADAQIDLARGKSAPTE